MSDSIHRRKVPNSVGNGSRSSRTRRTASRYVSDKKTRSNSNNRVFERSFSEPSLNRRRDGDSNYQRQPSPMRGLPTEESDPIVNLTRIRSEVFASSPSLSGFNSPASSSPINQESKAAAKVIINVAVEGSPGPVRAMVKLSCNVEETIKIVLAKYHEQGRTPKLHQNASFELHQSHFSIQCLDKREIIGDIGSRNFCLRKRAHETGVSSFTPVKISLIPSSNLMGSCIVQLIGKIMRRTRKIWNILVCMQ